MTRMRIKWLLILLCYVSALTAQDLDEQDRNWALTASFGACSPVITKNTSFEKGAGFGSIRTLMVEYYIPDTRFSLKGGYLGEEINLSGDSSASLSNLEVGGRYYFLPRRFVFQPYGGISTAWNLSPRTEKGVVTGSSYNPLKQEYQKDYETHYYIREPLFTASPVLGTDIYFLSCMAISVEYNFRIGVDGKMKNEIERFKPRETATVCTNGMRHTFSIGLKINFPFTVTEQDGNSIGQWLEELIFGDNR